MTIAIKSQQVFSSSFSLNPFSFVQFSLSPFFEITHSSPLRPSPTCAKLNTAVQVLISKADLIKGPQGGYSARYHGAKIDAKDCLFKTMASLMIESISGLPFYSEPPICCKNNSILNDEEALLLIAINARKGKHYVIHLVSPDNNFPTKFMSLSYPTAEIRSLDPIQDSLITTPPLHNSVSTPALAKHLLQISHNGFRHLPRRKMPTFITLTY